MLDAGWKNDLSARLIVGGEAVNESLAKRLTNISPAVWNFYGPTEATVWSTFSKLNSSCSQTVYVGNPIDNCRVYVLDENQQMIPKGVQGEIYIAGVNVSEGYLNQPLLTVEKFLPDMIASDGSKMYKTGDFGRWSFSGDLECLGRLDYQIKIRGFRVELNEIEATISTFKSVKECCVVVKSEGTNQYLVGYLTTNGNALDFNLDLLKSKLKDTLPDYMLPVIYVILDHFPLTSNGKIDRKALSQKDLSFETNCIQGEPAESITEKKLETLLHHLLKIEKKVDINKSFFEFGLTSIDLIKLLYKVNEQFNINLSFLSFYESPTVKSLASVIDNGRESLEKAIESPILALKKMNAKNNLFLFHPVGGTVFLYKKICDHLSTPINVYGIYDPGLITHEYLFNSIEEMASHYLLAIKKIQPSGNYYLGGASLGATLAFEVAQQLISSGDQVEFIGLLDGWALYPGEIIKESFLNNFISQHYTYLKNKWSEDGDHIPQPWYDLYYQRNKLVIAYHARMQASTAKVYLYKAKELLKIFRPFENEYNYWGKFSLDALIKHIVPGDHETMLQEPNAKIFASLLNHDLNNAMK